MTSTRPEPQLTDETITRFLGGLWKLNRRLKQGVEPRLAQQQIDLRRYFMLVTIRKGTVYPKELSEQLGVPSTLLSRYIDGLVQLGYIERNIDVQDSRRTVLSLTEAGLDAVTRATQSIREHTSQRLKELDPKQLPALLDALDTLGAAGLEQENR